MLDLALGYISQKYTHYYVLPDVGTDDRLRGVGKILDIVGEGALWYKKKTQKGTCSLHQGVDLLTKANKKVCDCLITLAKIMANSNEMKIILVSSEGAIMPMLEGLSAANWAIVYEIGDVSDEKACVYLVRNGIVKEKSDELVAFIGGRLVHLQTCITYLKKWQWCVFDCEEVKTDYFQWR